MNKKAIWWVVAIIVIILAAWAIRSSKGIEDSDDARTVKIGYFGPFTGPVAGTSGEDIANSVKLAESLNHTVGNKTIQVIYEDEGCDPKKAASAVQKLINVDKVDLLISGVCSGSTLAAAPIAETAKIPMLALAATAPAITTAGDYTFRTSASAEIIAPAVSAFLIKQGYKNIAILYEKADYTVGWKDALKKVYAATSTGNKVVAEESFAPTDTDLRTQLAKISQVKPEVIIIAGNSTLTANLAINQARDLGIKTPLVGNEYFGYPQVISNPNAEGSFGTIYKYDSNAPELKKLLSLYNEKYGKMPGLEVYTGLAYDGYNLLLNAIKTCDGAHSECIKDALYKTSNYPGVMGSITIDKNGDTLREFTLKKIHNGALEAIN